MMRWVMSQITKQIEKYRSGKLSFDKLLSLLTDRTYPPPERYINRPRDLGDLEAFIDSRPNYTDGTWDEVLHAYDSGLLTWDEYRRISDTFSEKHPKAS